MTDQDNLRDRIEDTIEAAYAQWEFEFEAHEDGNRAYVDPGPKDAFIAQAIIDEFRSDEAVERVADWLCEDDNGYKLSGHDEWCQDPACDLVESYRKSARDLIAALLGEDA